MSEFFESLIISIGGGAVALIGGLTIFKSLLIKLFETGLESSFEKNIEKFRNKLERTTRAYEILLDREMRFYEKIEPIIAELVPLEYDLHYYLQYHEGTEPKQEYERLRDHIKKYAELIKTLKNENLVHQSYIPLGVFSAFASVIKQMQDDLSYWVDMAKLVCSGEYEKIDYKKSEKIVDNFLRKLAVANTQVRVRLNELSGED